MKKLFVTLLLLGISCFGQNSDVRIPRGNGYISLTATCSNANTSCDGATTVFGENGTVQGPQTLEFNTQGYGLAVIYVNPNSTASGSAISFEFSDDGGTDWYQNSCTRTDTNVQLNTDSPPGSTARAYECSVGAATRGRVRQTAISSGSLLVSATLSAGVIEPAPTFQLSTTGTAGSNPCQNSHANLQTAFVSLSTTSLTQFIPLVAGQKIYGCSLIITNSTATNPVQIEYGTGSNCGTGTTVAIDKFTAPASTASPVAVAGPLFVTPAGQALCYIQSGTTPTASMAFNYVQQ